AGAGCQLRHKQLIHKLGFYNFLSYKKRESPNQRDFPFSFLITHPLASKTVYSYNIKIGENTKFYIITHVFFDKIVYFELPELPFITLTLYRFSLLPTLDPPTYVRNFLEI